MWWADLDEPLILQKADLSVEVLPLPLLTQSRREPRRYISGSHPCNDKWNLSPVLTFLGHSRGQRTEVSRIRVSMFTGVYDGVA
jgi:hypothetical protein